MASNPALLLEPRHCQVCHTHSRLKPCGSCLVVLYCCHEHRTQDQAAHEHPCNTVKTAVADLERAEIERLRHGLRQFSLYGIQGPPPCLQEKLNLVRKILEQFKNVTAVEESILLLDYILDDNRKDDLYARDILATLYLRLGRDQECYDFIKWWASVADTYDFDDEDQPYLDVKDAYILECPVQGLRIDRRINLSHAASVTLIKVRILLDLQHMQNAARAFNGALPRELIDMIRGEALVSSVVTPSKDIIQASVKATTEMLQLVKSQIKMLFDTVSRRSPEFWPSLVVGSLEAGTDLRGPHMTEMVRAFTYNHDAWRETPSAVGAIKGLVEMA